MKTKTNSLILLLFLSLFFASCVEEDPLDECSTSSSVDSEQSCPDGTGGTGDDNGPIDPTPGPDDPDQREPNPGKPGNPDRGNSFSSPWNRPDTTIVIDAYELNSINWNQMARDRKVAGVIHRSSIGMRIDKKYKERREIARQRGYLWGAYHLGKRGGTIEQAKLFLDLIDGDEETLMILDLEDTNSSRFMSLDQAIIFMEYVYEKTGRIPVVYANHSTTKLLNQRLASNPLLQQAKLWYARFKSHVTDFPKGIWNNYFLWQFSSEINCSRTGSCLYNVPGTRYDMDVNVYNGTESQLRYDWNVM